MHQSKPKSKSKSKAKPMKYGLKYGTVKPKTPKGGRKRP